MKNIVFLLLIVVFSADICGADVNSDPRYSTGHEAVTQDAAPKRKGAFGRLKDRFKRAHAVLRERDPNQSTEPEAMAQDAPKKKLQRKGLYRRLKDGIKRARNRKRRGASTPDEPAQDMSTAMDHRDPSQSTRPEAMEQDATPKGKGAFGRLKDRAKRAHAVLRER